MLTFLGLVIGTVGKSLTDTGGDKERSDVSENEPNARGDTGLRVVVEGNGGGELGELYPRTLPCRYLRIDGEISSSLSSCTLAGDVGVTGLNGGGDDEPRSLGDFGLRNVLLTTVEVLELVLPRCGTGMWER